MFKVRARIFIDTTEKRLSHAPLHAVEDLHFVRIHIFAPRFPSHRNLLLTCLISQKPVQSHAPSYRIDNLRQ